MYTYKHPEFKGINLKISALKWQTSFTQSETWVKASVIPIKAYRNNHIKCLSTTAMGCW